jgi:putative transposase
MRPTCVLRSAIVLKPSTLLHLHHLLKTRKYRLLFSPHCRRQPGPKGPSDELTDAVVDMKRRNPRWGCPRIAQRISVAFGVEIDKDVVRRILASHDRSEPDLGGPSWLTFLGHLKDSLWSIDLFRCESLTLRTHWDSRRDGSLHAAHHWVWHSPGSSRWFGAVSDVQSSDARPILA